MASASTTTAVKRKGKGKPKAEDAAPEAAAPAAADAAPAEAAPDASSGAAAFASASAPGRDRRDRDCAPAPAMRFVGLFAVLLTAVLCGVLYFLFAVLGDDLISARDVGPEVMYPPDLPAVAVTGKVRRVRLPDDETYDFASTFSAAGEPVILTNTPADKWAAAQWTPKTIAAAVPELHNIQTHPNRTFYYFHAEHPLAHVQSIAAERKAITYDRIEAMPTGEFFRRISRPVNTIDGEDFIYYASKVENFGELYFDMKPIDRFMVREKGAKDWERIETNVWIGPENATTHAHYDIQHSFYVQLQGSKRFLLWPPEQIDAMYIYPFLHPGHQSSQIDLENVDSGDFPRFAQECRALEAILYPGDVMYLPPLWMHHVTALTPSMSISVWTSHAEHDVMDALETQGLPFPPQWKLTQRIPGGLHLLRMILNHPELRDRSGARAIVRALIANRYFRVFRDHPSVARNGFPDICALPLGRALRDPENAVSKSWAEFALNAVRSFNLMTNPHRRTVWLRNYVEMVAHMSAGVERVGGFLRCLSEAATDDAAPAAVAVAVETEDAEPESDYE